MASKATVLNAAAAYSLGKQSKRATLAVGTSKGMVTGQSVRLLGVGGTVAKLRETSNIEQVLLANHKRCKDCEARAELIECNEKMAKRARTERDAALKVIKEMKSELQGAFGSRKKGARVCAEICERHGVELPK